MYHVFAGDNHYPMAGLGDYIDSYVYLDQAIFEAERAAGDWCCVLTTTSDGKLISVYGIGESPLRESNPAPVA